MEGFEDARGTLFFEIAKILKSKPPKMFVLENVKQLKSHDSGRTFKVIVETLEGLGYKIRSGTLNALDFGLPQKRERTIIVGFLDRSVEFEFPKPLPAGRLADVLEPDDQVDPKHFASGRIRESRESRHVSVHFPGIWHENKSGSVSSHPHSCALRAGASYNYLLVNGKRRLTPREMLRLQGFPDSFKLVCSDSQTRRQAGNAVPVNVVREVLKAALAADAAAAEKSGRSRKDEA
jgi:DNA (cytosine-5)-methyltransferase 1